MSLPEKLTFKKGDYGSGEISYLNEFGPKLIHKYGIINEGLIGIEEIDVRIISLNTTLDGKNSFFASKNFVKSLFITLRQTTDLSIRRTNPNRFECHLRRHSNQSRKLQGSIDTKSSQL